MDLALRRTMQTAGRTVVFSAATVAVSLAALLLFPMAYLKSYAYGGITVVAAAALGALTILPALIVVLGDRVTGSRKPRGDGQGFWGRQAIRVMRRPGTRHCGGYRGTASHWERRFMHLRVGLIDDESFRTASAPGPSMTQSVRTSARERLTRPPSWSSGCPATTRHTGPRLMRLPRSCSTSASRTHVDGATGHYLLGIGGVPDLTTKRFETAGSTWFSIVPSENAISWQSERIVRDVRALDLGHPFLVTGPTARFVDSKDAVNAGGCPYALGADRACHVLVCCSRCSAA